MNTTIKLSKRDRQRFEDCKTLPQLIPVVLRSDTTGKLTRALKEAGMA